MTESDGPKKNESISGRQQDATRKSQFCGPSWNAFADVSKSEFSSQEQNSETSQGWHLLKLQDGLMVR